MRRIAGKAGLVDADLDVLKRLPHIAATRVEQRGEEDVAALPGVVVVSNSREAFAVAAGAAPARSQAKVVTKPLSKGPEKSRPVPLLRKTIGTYNIVEYEGWYYGLPHSLGPIDLQKVDVIEMPGVIRDVSASVVERLIQELIR